MMCHTKVVLYVCVGGGVRGVGCVLVCGWGVVGWWGGGWGGGLFVCVICVHTTCSP